MVSVDLLLLVTFISTALLAVVLGYLYATTRSDYLRDWTIHWALVSGGLALTLSPWGRDVGTVTVSNQFIGLLSAYYLARGALALQQRPWPRLGWTLLSAVAAWIVASSFWSPTFTVETLPPYAVRGGLAIWAGYLLLRLPASSYGIERWVPGVALIIDGAHLADYPFLGQSEAFLPWALVISVSDRFVIGIGMLLLFFRQARSAAEASERHFRSVFESSPMATTIGEMDEGRVLDANRAMDQILGYPPEELVGTIPREMPIWVHRTKRDEMMARIRETGMVRDFRVDMRHKDGSLRKVSLTGAAIRLPEGERLLVMGHDVTEQVATEEHLRRLVRILESTPDLVGIWDREGRPVYLNGAARAALGVSGEDALARGAEAEHLLDGDVLRSALRSAMDSGTWEGEATVRFASGKARAMSLVLIAHRDARGEVQNFSVLGRDISGLRDLQGQLLQAQKLEALGRLAGGVAHDFNNLLTVIGGYAQDLEESGATAEDRDAAREILRASERAAGLTRQLLAFARKQEVAPTVFDVDQALRDVERMLRRLIGEDVTLSVTPGSGVRVHMDPRQFDQVVVNLAVNARDALEPGGSIVITSRRVKGGEVSPQGAGADFGFAEASGAGSGFVELVVRDDGAGMEEEVRARALDPFFTTKSQGKGTGLGLSTVYGIVEQAGGFLRIVSAPGEGTEVRVFLPEARSLDEERVRRPGTGAGTLDGRRVLVVEDEPGVRHLVVRHLKALGCTPVEAADGEEGLIRIAQEADLDGLVSDVVMPKAGGGVVARRFLEAHPDGGVVLMSGYTDDRLDADLLAEPGVEFIHKPFNRDALADALWRAVQARPVDGAAERD